MYQLPIAISPIIMEVETGCNYYWGDRFFTSMIIGGRASFGGRGFPKRSNKNNCRRLFIYSYGPYGFTTFLFIFPVSLHVMFCFPVVFWSFTMVGCIKKLQVKLRAACFFEGCEAFQVAIPHPGCNLPYRLRRCRMVLGGFLATGVIPQVPLRSGGCFFRDKVDQSSPEYLGKILMLYDMHIIYFHQKCTIYQKSY